MKVIPQLKKTLDGNIVDLIIKKENPSTPTNILNANILLVNTHFLLNEEKFPYKY